jgi:hypothetical protein
MNDDVLHSSSRCVSWWGLRVVFARDDVIRCDMRVPLEP